mmetsp:Transcript_124723/g.249050  ORF Transcript_124723/g.249050 Transcript_124723/m.249050 type:complete len:265 (+) Transcript_124723:1954-2748(+)
MRRAWCVILHQTESKRLYGISPLNSQTITLFASIKARICLQDDNIKALVLQSNCKCSPANTTASNHDAATLARVGVSQWCRKRCIPPLPESFGKSLLSCLCKRPCCVLKLLIIKVRQTPLCRLGQVSKKSCVQLTCVCKRPCHVGKILSTEVAQASSCFFSQHLEQLRIQLPCFRKRPGYAGKMLAVEVAQTALNRPCYSREQLHIQLAYLCIGPCCIDQVLCVEVIEALLRVLCQSREQLQIHLTCLGKSPCYAGKVLCIEVA